MVIKNKNNEKINNIRKVSRKCVTYLGFKYIHERLFELEGMEVRVELIDFHRLNVELNGKHICIAERIQYQRSSEA